MIRTGIDLTDTMETTVTPNAVLIREKNGDAITLYGTTEQLLKLAKDIFAQLSIEMEGRKSA
jgi:hypothetical protein